VKIVDFEIESNGAEVSVDLDDGSVEVWPMSDFRERVLRLEVPQTPVVISVLPNEDGALPCPHEDCNGHVVEVDQAVRWNRLYVEDGRLVTSTDGDHDWERADPGFLCDTCDRSFELDAALDDITYT
jgi:hypothetical protein